MVDHILLPYGECNINTENNCDYRTDIHILPIGKQITIYKIIITISQYIIANNTPLALPTIGLVVNF